MPVRYINFNGEMIHDRQPVLSVTNRSFRYGDGLFETMLWTGEEIRFLSYHVQRLQEGMKTLHMDDPGQYDEAFMTEKATQLITKNGYTGKVRLRLSVYRAGEGLYSPEINRTAYVLEATPLSAADFKNGLIVDVYQEYRKPYSGLSKLKTANSLIYVMAGLYRKQKGVDDVLVLNQDGFLCESVSSNIFVWYDGKLYTPALSEGCVAGVMRRVVIELAAENNYEVVEAQINPDIMHLADELFFTNSIQGIQWVLGYKKKRYFKRISKMLQEKLVSWGQDTADAG